MNRLIFLILVIATYNSCVIRNEMQQESNLSLFNQKKDFLLLNYDCKTDVDDLHSIAAFASLIRIPNFSNLDFHAVAGTYGTQEGKYVPPNSLFSLAFADDDWSDAHTQYEKSLDDVYLKIRKVLKKGGNIWIAEAGQSDFSSSLITKVQNNMHRINTKERIKIVQHSDWNEKETSKDDLTFVKMNSDYFKIPDGNTAHNGSPGFATPDSIDWENIIEDEEIKAIWDLATSLADTYNGYEGRYLNKTIDSGGLDFSDFCEVHYILKLREMENCSQYFNFIQNKS